jgi:hypothetical protein
MKVPQKAAPKPAAKPKAPEPISGVFKVACDLLTDKPGNDKLKVAVKKVVRETFLFYDTYIKGSLLKDKQPELV